MEAEAVQKNGGIILEALSTIRSDDEQELARSLVDGEKEGNKDGAADRSFDNSSLMAAAVAKQEEKLLDESQHNLQAKIE